MKKFYAFAAAALAAISMNAQDAIYVVGNGPELGWDLPGKKVEKGADGNFVFEVTECSSLKIGTVETTDWDGDEGFNASAIGVGNPANPNEILFSADAVQTENGETKTLESWGENTNLPYSGSYTITVAGDFQTITVKATTPPPTTIDLYLMGTLNDWSASEDFHFTQDGTVYSLEVVLSTEDNFKISTSNWDDQYNFGYDAAIEPSKKGTVINGKGNTGNMSLTEDYLGVLVLDLTNADAPVLRFPDSPREAGIADVAVDFNLPVEYFNLQGVRVANPENGLFIARQGKAVTKVVK